MSYKPPGYSQMDGSAFQRSNCVFATCTDLIDRVTVGALRIAAPELRRASGDTSGGVSYSQAAATVLKVTTAKGRPVHLEPRYGLSRTQVRDLARAGIPFGISIWTGVTADTRFRTGTFIGGHTVYDQAWKERYFEVEDPGTTAAGYMLWPEDLLFRAAEARGGGLINVLAGRDTEGVRRVGISGKVYASPYRSSTVRASVVKDAPYTVVRTVNGGGWPRADGGTSYGWYEIQRSTGTAFVTGGSLK